jgi:hypothetical protein
MKKNLSMNVFQAWGTTYTPSTKKTVLQTAKMMPLPSDTLALSRFLNGGIFEIRASMVNSVIP